jgi:hypothetical protein
MKKLKEVQIVAVLLLLVTLRSLSLSAQSEAIIPGMAATIPCPGYVVLSNGDTLFGKIRWALKYVENNPVEVKFTAENGESKNLNASDIRGFGNTLKTWLPGEILPVYLKGENYESLPSFKKGVPVFMNRLLTGRVTVFQNRSSTITGGSQIGETTRISGISFTFNSGEGLTIGPRYRTDYRIVEGRAHFGSYFVKKDGGAIIKVERSNYDSLFKTLFGDCSAIDQELIKNPELSWFKNFMIVAEIYNQIYK